MLLFGGLAVVVGDFFTVVALLLGVEVVLAFFLLAFSVFIILLLL